MRKLSYMSFVAAPLCMLLLAGCGGDNNHKSGDATPAASFSVERNKTDKVYTLNIEGDGHWQVFAGETPDSIDVNTIIVEGNGTQEINLTSFPTDRRIYFQYVLENSTQITASERLLPMEEADNTRDLGGYKTAYGKTVKYGKVFRSGDLSKLTIADITYLENIGIKTIVDFRANSERDAAPDVNISSVINNLEYPIGSGGSTDIQQITSRTIDQNKQSLIDANRDFVINNQEEYKGFFEALMNNQNPPLLFHCTAGKDRAGFAAAMFLSALGVNREIIIEDYLLSGIYREEKNAPLISQYPNLAPVLTVYKEYIQAAFDTIDAEYGGVESYLQNELNVDLELMRAIYTE